MRAFVKTKVLAATEKTTPACSESASGIAARARDELLV